MEDQVSKALSKEREQTREKLESFEQLKHELRIEKDANKGLTDMLEEKDSLINKYKQELKNLVKDLPEGHILKGEMPNFLNFESFREDRLIDKKTLQKLTSQNAVLAGQMETVLAENRVLRKMANVPENYGFDLEEVKLAERQQLEDYKSQVRYLEKEIEELEEERTKLRFRLRQISSVFSNKPGERYKDMSPDQLYMIDQYAMNLKEGINEV